MTPKPSPSSSVLNTLRSPTFWTQTAKGITGIVAASIIQISFSQWMNPAPGSEKAVLVKKMGKSFGEAHPKRMAVPRRSQVKAEEMVMKGQVEKTELTGLEVWGF